MTCKSIIASFAFAAMLCGAPVPLTHHSVDAQTVAAGLVPLMVRYEYFPHYYSQAISGSDEYLQIEAFLDDSPKDNATRIALTDKATGKQTYFAPNPATVEALQREGYRAFLSPLDIKKPEQSIQRAIAGFAFRDDKGQAIRWRFVYAYSASAMGSGLTPLPEMAGLELQYRNEGSVAAEGSAVEVASKVSYVAMWKEISAPPYFVAYHGYSGEGFHSARFATLDEKWEVAGTAENTWDLQNASGQRQSYRVTKNANSETVLNTWIADSQTSIDTFLKGEGADQRLHAIRAYQKGHTMTISFKSDVELAAASGSVDFQIDMDNTKRVVRGSVEQVVQNGEHHFLWRFKSPDWAKARTLDEAMTVTPTEVALHVTQR